MAEFDQQFLHEDYFYAHSEPHRRRPTVGPFPRLIVHTATFYNPTSHRAPRGWIDRLKRLFNVGQPHEARERFRKLLRAVFETATWKRILDDDTRAEFDPEFLDRFCSAVPRIETGAPSAAERRGADFEFAFEAECCAQKQDSVVVRIERHAEYFTITVFAPLDETTRSLTAHYDAVNAHVPTQFEDAPPNGPPLHLLFWNVALFFPQCTFANFRGVVGHAGHLPVAANGAKPQFSAYDRDGATTQVAAARETEFYLRALKDHLGESVFAAGARDAIACYMQNGQVIYVSSMGAQRVRQAGDNDRPHDQLRYLLLYQAPGDEPALPQHLVALGGRDESRERFRLSRLVHRINTIGTLRLAALRDLAVLRRLNEELKQIELDLEPAVSAPFEQRDERLMQVIRRLEDLAGRSMHGGVPIFYRTSRAHHYFKQMERLVADLNIGDIPDWQNYGQFLRRRLYSSLDFNSNFGKRVIELWQLARSRAEFIESRTLLLLQDIATVAAAIVVPLAVADSLSKAGVAFTLGAWTWTPEYVPVLQISALLFGTWLLFRRLRAHRRGRRNTLSEAPRLDEP